MAATSLFAQRCPVIGCVHMSPLPGAPLYDGDIEQVYAKALAEARELTVAGVDGLIVENFQDKPFYPDRVPAETVAALAVITREISKACNIPVGVNVLRNDGESALAIAAATGAQFVRVNVHMGVAVSEQGFLVGRSHEILRLRSALKTRALIFADVGVKHAAPLAGRGIQAEAIDAQDRGLADALIVSGARTGAAAEMEDLAAVNAVAKIPVFLGSGVTGKNLGSYIGKMHGAIVGSDFKEDGIATNKLDMPRITYFMGMLNKLRADI